MFGLYGRRMRRNLDEGPDKNCGHDTFNYMNPNVNYDKMARKLKKRKKRIINEDCTCAIDYDLNEIQLAALKKQPHTEEECKNLRHQLEYECDQAQRAEILSKFLSCVNVEDISERSDDGSSYDGT